MRNALALAESGLVPRPLLRYGIRRLVRLRLAEQELGGAPEQRRRLDELIRSLSSQPIAVATAAANEQHYEVPAELFQLALGPRLKYSCCLWGPGDDLAEAELRMLELTSRRAHIADGQRILELGCGWGSLTLFLAERFPGCEIVAVSNSASQRRFIEQSLRARALDNVRVLTRDVNDLAADPEIAADFGDRFDRVVSVEMLEHTRNLGRLLERVRAWLRPDGKLFVHVFCHRRFAYLFEDHGDDDWMARHFFTGGMMPSFDLLPRLRGQLELERRWQVDGRHYARTARAWLDNLDRHRLAARRVLDAVHGNGTGRLWLQRWRLFFLAVEELFGFRGGSEWMVGHYRLGRS